jgi:hypothetical protein
MRFFCGLHQPNDARHFDAAFISVNRLRGRKSPFLVGDWILDFDCRVIRAAKAKAAYWQRVKL